jgi:hypothetical protein
MDNIKFAAARINASPIDDGYWIYYADEIAAYCYVTDAELAKLGELLKTDPRHGYSHWCAGSETRTEIA